MRANQLKEGDSFRRKGVTHQFSEPIKTIEHTNNGTIIFTLRDGQTRNLHENQKIQLSND